MDSNDQAQIDALQRQLAELTYRVIALESRPVPGMPLGPLLAPQLLRSCSGCGLRFSNTLSYTCTRVNCPSGLGPATANTAA